MTPPHKTQQWGEHLIDEGIPQIQCMNIRTIYNNYYTIHRSTVCRWSSNVNATTTCCQHGSSWRTYKKMMSCVRILRGILHTDIFQSTFKWDYMR